MRYQIIETDFPSWEDVPCEVPEEIERQFHKLYKNSYGFKLGGWPILIQSEIFRAPNNTYPTESEYVFQIDSVVKANW